MRIDPTITEDTAPFWRAARQGRLVLPTCSDGHREHAWLPPIGVCPRCMSRHISWKEERPEGTLISWVTYRRMFIEQFPVPYVIAMVGLDSGPRLTVLLRERDSTPREVGNRVAIRFQRLAGDEWMPVGTVIGTEE